MTWNLYILLVRHEGCLSHLNACCKEKEFFFFFGNCAAGIEQSGNLLRGMCSLVRLGISSRKVCLLLGTRLHSSCTAWPLKMGPMGGTETSVRNYHYTLRKIPEGRRSSAYSSSQTGTVSAQFFKLLFVFDSVVSSVLLTLVPSTQLWPISLYVWVVLSSYCNEATLEFNKVWLGPVRIVIHVIALDLMLRWTITEDGLKPLH
jgi:hypothetical protein